MKIIRDIRYSPKSVGGSRLGDLYLPETAAAGAALAIHGGGWSALNRRSFAGGAEFLCRDLGLVTFNIEYRLVGETPWPACGDDCLEAANYFLKELLPQYFSGKPPRILVVGGSAGGQLALVTGLRLPADEVSGIVSISGIDALEPDFKLRPDRYRGLFGAEPTEELIAEASPMTYLTPDSPPILCTHTRYDEVVPFASAEEFLRRAKEEKGVTVQSYFYDRRNDGHCIWIPGSDPHRLYPDIEDAISRFTAGCAR